MTISYSVWIYLSGLLKKVTLWVHAVEVYWIRKLIVWSHWLVQFDANSYFYPTCHLGWRITRSVVKLELICLYATYYLIFLIRYFWCFFLMTTTCLYLNGRLFWQIIEQQSVVRNLVSNMNLKKPPSSHISQRFLRLWK